MTYEQIRREIASPTATITLNRPEAMNAITVVMLGELADALAKIATDPSIRAVIITGEGRAFSAGVDLKKSSLQRSMASASPAHSNSHSPAT